MLNYLLTYAKNDKHNFIDFLKNFLLFLQVNALIEISGDCTLPNFYTYSHGQLELEEGN